MGKINFENLNPNRNGIIVEGRTIVVRGYDFDRKIQIYFDQKENLTSRVVGVNILGKHYLINKGDYNYSECIPGHDNLPQLERVYVLTNYDEEKKVAYGEDILIEDKKLLEYIVLSLFGD